MREAMALSEDKYLITRRKLLLLSLPFGYAIVNESKANSNSPIKVLNVLNFGAKGDGINDDSYAFQQACNTASSLGGAKLYIPPTKEYYRILFPVYIGDNTELFGEGQTTRIVFENPIFNKGRGGFVIGSSLEANRHLAFKRYSNFTQETTINPDFKNPKQKQYLRDNPHFIQAENSSIHDLYLEARFTNSTKNKWGGYGINFVNAQNCHVYNIWGKGWTQLIGMGSDIPAETPSNHLCSAKYLHVLEPDLVRTYYSIGFIANSTDCSIEHAIQYVPMTSGSLNGSGAALNLCEDCLISNITIPHLGKTQTSEGIMVNNSSGCRVNNIMIGDAKIAVSLFFSDKSTLNPEKPNFIDTVTGVNCNSVISVFSKYNYIKNITAKDCIYKVVLKNRNATNNHFDLPASEIVTANTKDAGFLLKNNTFQ